MVLIGTKPESFFFHPPGGHDLNLKYSGADLDRSHRFKKPVKF